MAHWLWQFTLMPFEKIQQLSCGWWRWSFWVLFTEPAWCSWISLVANFPEVTSQPTGCFQMFQKPNLKEDPIQCCYKGRCYLGYIISLEGSAKGWKITNSDVLCRRYCPRGIRWLP
jgi:hypothetical protein